MTNVCLYIFCLFVIVSCIGCDNIFEDEVYFDAPIQIEALCISEDRPTEVVMSVFGFKGSGCGDKSFKNVYVDRVGNTIFLTPTITEGLQIGISTCSAEIEYRGETILKTLEVGEYSIWAGDSEALRLHIEAEKASVLLRPRIREFTTVQMKTSEGIQRFDSFPEPWIETTEPVQVTIGVEGYFAFGSHIEAVSKITCIEREAEEIKVDLFGEVRIDDCLQDTSFTERPWGETEIDLGLFTAGDYRVNVNGDKVWFSIRLPVR